MESYSQQNKAAKQITVRTAIETNLIIELTMRLVQW
jgi:hypothetical protein